MSLADLSPELIDHLVRAVDVTRDHDHAHLEWLRSDAAAAEPDRDQQLAATERALVLADQLASLLPTALSSLKSFIMPSLDLTPELLDFLIHAIDLTRERDEEHLQWLASHADEADREQQIAETERSLAVADQLMVVLTRGEPNLGGSDGHRNH